MIPKPTNPPATSKKPLNAVKKGSKRVAFVNISLKRGQLGQSCITHKACHGLRRGSPGHETTRAFCIIGSDCLIEKSSVTGLEIGVEFVVHRLGNDSQLSPFVEERRGDVLQLGDGVPVGEPRPKYDLGRIYGSYDEPVRVVPGIDGRGNIKEELFDCIPLCDRVLAASKKREELL